MRHAALSLVVLASAGAAAAAPTSAPVSAFAGYNAPDVTADNCSLKSPGLVECFIPGKTMGRYLITVRGAATSTGPDAIQGIVIGGSGWSCGQATSQKGAWSGSRGFVADCNVTILSDDPVKISAAFGGAQIQLDPKGPKVTIQRMPWDGVLNAGGLQARIETAGAPAPGPAKSATRP
jgi:hypothetical protein